MTYGFVREIYSSFMIYMSEASVGVEGVLMPSWMIAYELVCSLEIDLQASGLTAAVVLFGTLVVPNPFQRALKLYVQRAFELDARSFREYRTELSYFNSLLGGRPSLGYTTVGLLGWLSFSTIGYLYIQKHQAG